MPGFEDPFIPFCKTAIEEVSCRTKLYSTIPASDLPNYCEVQSTRDQKHSSLHFTRESSALSAWKRSGEPGPGTLQAATSQPAKLHQGEPRMYMHAHLLELHSMPSDVTYRWEHLGSLRSNIVSMGEYERLLRSIGYLSIWQY